MSGAAPGKTSGGKQQACKDVDGAGGKSCTASVSNSFSPHLVLLGGKCENAGGHHQEDFVWFGEEQAAGSAVKCRILDAEGTEHLRAQAAVFTWLEEEEERQIQAVANVMALGAVGSVVCSCPLVDMVEER